jgi:uncharacterized membrane protein
VTGQRVDTVIVVAAVGLVYAAVLIAVFRYTAARTPAGIVRRLFRTSRPVTVVVSVANPSAWWG